MVISEELAGGFGLYLTAGTRLLYLVSRPPSLSIAVRNTARPAERHGSGEIPNLQDAAIHRQAVRYHRPSGDIRFLPLQFQAVMHAGDKDKAVRGVAYRAMRLDKHGRLSSSEYVALQAWLTQFWRHAGTSSYFDKRRVEFVVRNNPPGAPEARAVLDNVQNAYCLAMKDTVHAYLEKKQ